MGVSTRFRWCYPIEYNSTVYLFQGVNLQAQSSFFENLKGMNKDLEKIFHLYIIIDNPIYII